MNDNTPTPTRLLTVRQWAKIHPWPTEAGMRHLIFHAGENGFGEAFLQIGRNRLIDEAKFFKIAQSRNMADCPPKTNRKPVLHRASGGRWR